MAHLPDGKYEEAFLIDLAALASSAPDQEVISVGRDLIANDRTIGGAVHLIKCLSKARRHELAERLGDDLYKSRYQTRHLNVFLTSVLSAGATKALSAALAIVKSHEPRLQSDYDVQLVTTWLRALYESNDRAEFLRVYESVCHADDHKNEYVAAQYLRFLIRDGKYDIAAKTYNELPTQTRNDELLRKLAARAYIEVGQVQQAEAAIADTRDDFAKRSVIAKIAEYRSKVGLQPQADSAVKETPADGSPLQAAGKPVVFIVHGHDHSARAALENVLHRIGAQPATFDTLPIPGSPTVIEVLEKNVPAADAVVTLLTADDEGRKRGTEDPLTYRGRENCLIEAGYAMISRRTRSILIALGGVNIPSDFHGIHRIEANEWNTDVALRVANRLRDMGFAIEPANVV
ncbi:MAG: TIR domain-containing protein [Gammaproteobacteria bacterium]